MLTHQLDPRGRRRDRDFDPVVEGARLGLSRAQALAIWTRVCADLDPGERAHRFRVLAARGPHPGRSAGAGHANDGRAAAAPGRETRVDAEAARWPAEPEVAATGQAAPILAAPSRPPPGHGLARLFAPARGAAAVAPAATTRDHVGVLADDPAPAPDGGGEPLPIELQHRMGRAFGADFSSVRVFHGDEATALGAAAFAHGEDLHFAPGHYDPRSPAGQQLIGHELAHVVQQRLGRVAAAHDDDSPVNADPALEAEADALGARAARGELAAIAGGGSGGGAVQLTAYKGKAGGGKVNEARMLACHGRQLVFVVDAKNVAIKTGKLTKPITVGDIKAKLGKEAPELTITGAINMVGEHTITVKVGKVDVVIAVSVRAPEGLVVRPVAPKDPYPRPSDGLAEPTPDADGPAPRVAQFGTEFTFTNPQMYKEARDMAQGGMQEKRGAENTRLQKKWKDAVVAHKPPDLAYIEDLVDKDGYPSIQFTYTDGWWYRCSLDVACIETQTYKMSLADAETRGWLARLERDVFAIAAELGLETHVMTGGGHLHLDLVTSFGGDFELFRNFLVDFANNPLALEALENDPTNAPVIGQLQDDVRIRFLKLIAQFDAMKLADKYKTGNDAIVALADALQYGVYKHAFSHLPNHEQFDEPWKYQAVNVSRIADPTQDVPDKTVEIRALRAQRSVGELLLVARLLQARIAMLKAEHSGDRIAYDVGATRPQSHSDPSAVIEAFRIYVEQAGLTFADYEALVHANMVERHHGWAPPERGAGRAHGDDDRGDDRDGRGRDDRGGGHADGHGGGHADGHGGGHADGHGGGHADGHGGGHVDGRGGGHVDGRGGGHADDRGAAPSRVGSSREGDDAVDHEMIEHDRRDAEANAEQTVVGPGDRRYRLAAPQIELLLARGLRLTGTRPNGDCIYNSVSESAGLGVDAGELREVAATWCEEHRELILETQLVEVEESQRAAAFDRAVAAIRATGERQFFGEHGDLSLMALSERMAGRGVSVLHPDGQLVQLSDGADPIVLVRVTEPLPHYYGTRPA